MRSSDPSQTCDRRAFSAARKTGSRVLHRQTVDAFGREVALQPDMTLRADIILERRSLIEWLLEPLLSVRHRMS